MNCAAIPHELLESELFGYEPARSPGAIARSLASLTRQTTDTIFLDEISEMHPALQAKLLHVLQDGEFGRLGGKRDISVDVRFSRRPISPGACGRRGSVPRRFFYSA